MANHRILKVLRVQVPTRDQAVLITDENEIQCVLKDGGKSGLVLDWEAVERVLFIFTFYFDSFGVTFRELGQIIRPNLLIINQNGFRRPFNRYNLTDCFVLEIPNSNFFIRTP